MTADSFTPILKFISDNFWFIAIPLVGLGIVYSVRQARKRREALEQAAMQRGFRYEPKEPPGFLDGYSRFKLFQKGHGKHASNILSGAHSVFAATVFDYQYTVGSGRNSSTYLQTVVALDSDQLNLPAFTLGPENFFHRIGDLFGFRDIDFETNPAFSRKFLLKGADEARVRGVFGPDVLSVLEARPFAGAVEGEGRSMIFYRTGGRARPEELFPRLDEAAQIAALFLGR